MKAKGKTILISTHNMRSVEEICDRVALIHQSKKIMEGRGFPIARTRPQKKKNKRKKKKGGGCFAIMEKGEKRRKFFLKRGDIFFFFVFLTVFSFFLARFLQFGN